MDNAQRTLARTYVGTDWVQCAVYSVQWFSTEFSSVTGAGYGVLNS